MTEKEMTQHSIDLLIKKIIEKSDEGKEIYSFLPIQDSRQRDGQAPTLTGSITSGDIAYSEFKRNCDNASKLKSIKKIIDSVMKNKDVSEKVHNLQITEENIQSVLFRNREYHDINYLDVEWTNKSRN